MIAVTVANASISFHADDLVVAVVVVAVVVIVAVVAAVIVVVTAAVIVAVAAAVAVAAVGGSGKHRQTQASPKKHPITGAADVVVKLLISLLL